MVDPGFLPISDHFCEIKNNHPVQLAKQQQQAAVKSLQMAESLTNAATMAALNKSSENLNPSSAFDSPMENLTRTFNFDENNTNFGENGNSNLQNKLTSLAPTLNTIVLLNQLQQKQINVALNAISCSGLNNFSKSSLSASASGYQFDPFDQLSETSRITNLLQQQISALPTPPLSALQGGF